MVLPQSTGCPQLGLTRRITTLTALTGQPDLSLSWLALHVLIVEWIRALTPQNASDSELVCQTLSWVI